MNILITGAGGFVGTHLCRSLYKDYNVIGTVRTKNRQIALEKVCRIKTYVADLSKDIEIDDKIDIVIHGAARSPSPGIPINNYIYDNIITTQNLIHFSTRKKVRLFIYLSTISVFGSINSTKVDEKTPIVDPEPYGLSKYFGELLLKENENNLSSIIFRMPIVIGKVMQNGWLYSVYKKIQNNEELIYYNPESPYNMIHLEDLCSLIKCSINSNLKKSNLFTVSCNNLLSVQKIIDTIKKKSDSTSKLIVKKNSQVGFIISNKNAIETLGFKPQNAKKILSLFLGV